MKALFYGPFVVGLLLQSLWLHAQEAKNCDCEHETWQQAFANADHVVFGEVKFVKAHNGDLATGDFTVMETFKGDATFVKKIVGSAKAGVSCRKVLRNGYYIAYAKDNPNVVLNQCAASRQLRDDLVQTLAELKQFSESDQGHPGMGQSSGKSGSQDEEASDWIQGIIDWFDW